MILQKGPNRARKKVLIVLNALVGDLVEQDLNSNPSSINPGSPYQGNHEIHAKVLLPGAYSRPRTGNPISKNKDTMHCEFRFVSCRINIHTPKNLGKC
ncbi:unnamed protein product [Larinioides sclopetarius]|uniref:Uncharacterized protein n=1 Tax=Larinioides sclopetarius TaxID=280406 RepID=A0AAV1ZAB7_9ARAC